MVQSTKGSAQMSLSYDHATDTLYIYFGDMKDSVARDKGNGILIQYNRKTNIPVGAIVHDFEQRFKKTSNLCELPLGDLITA